MTRAPRVVGAKARRLALGAFLLVSSAAGLAGCPCADRVELVRDGAPLAAFCVEVKDDERARSEGLRGRASLDEHEGVLLVFPIEDRVCLTNEGVAFAIDALFADDDGVLTETARLEAEDPTPLCREPARVVLEVVAGAAAGAEPGDALALFGEAARALD